MNQKFTDRAIAYLKAAVANEDSHSIELSQAGSPVIHPFSEDLCVCYVVEEDNSYHYVQERHLSQDGTSGTELKLIGLGNLKELVGKREIRVHTYQNIHPVLMGGDFEASLILLDQLWENEFRQFVVGDYALAIPARDILAFCSGDSLQGIDELRQLIKRVTAGGDHLISERIWMRQKGQIVLRPS